MRQAEVPERLAADREFGCAFVYDAQLLGRRLGGHSGDSYGACVEWTASWSLLLIGLAVCALRR